MSYRLYSPARHFYLSSKGSDTSAKLREVFFLIGEDAVVLWSDASDSAVRLPDSRARWEAIWSRRDQIIEIAHSHPVGPLTFSHEDETTMRALVTALGRPIAFSVIAPSGMVRRTERVVANTENNDASVTEVIANEPWWTTLLRLASGMDTTRDAPVSRSHTVAQPLEDSDKPA